MASSRSSDSSPDPLSRSIDRLYPPSSPLKQLPNTTPQRHRILKPTVSRQSSPSKPLNSSPNQHHDVALNRGESVVLTTPAKAREGAGGRTSPLKIRLTVETDPDEEQSGFEVYEKTTTIIVPLKGEDEHQPVKRRVQRRKSLLGIGAVGLDVSADDTMTERPSLSKRTTRARSRDLAIASPGARGSGAQISGIAADTVETPAVKPRGRPRKSTPLDAAKTSTTSVQKTAAAGRPKRITKMNFADLTPLHLKQSVLPHSEDAALQLTPWEVRKTRGSRAAQKIRERVQTPRKPTLWDDSTTTPNGFSSAAKPIPFSDEVAKGSGTRSKRARDTLASDNPFADAPDDECNGEDADGATGMEDDTTMLDRSAVESEGFSMVSIDSLRPRHVPAKVLDSSHASHASYSKPQTRASALSQTMLQNHGHPRSPPTSSPTTAPFEVRGGSKTSPGTSIYYSENENASKTHVHVPALVVTTSIDDPIYTPEVPKPLTEPSNAHREHSISTDPAPPENGIRSTKKRKSDEGVFDAFGVATKRHLRAGLAMGELLARNEIGFLGDAGRAVESSLFDEHTARNEVSQPLLDNEPRLPTPAASVESGSGPVSAQSTEIVNLNQALGQSAQVLRSVRQDFSSSPPRLVSSPIPQRRDDRSSAATCNVHDRTELGRTELLEREYQHEREDVIRQIQAANTSQIIRIDSDDVEEDADHIRGTTEMEINNEHNILPEAQETIADIWREEADRSLQDELPRRIAGKNKSSPKPQTAPESPAINFADLFAADLKPSRAKLPRTWRRVSGKDFHYSDEAETPALPTGQTTVVAVGAAPASLNGSEVVEIRQLALSGLFRPAENTSRQSVPQTGRSSPRKAFPVNRSPRRNRTSGTSGKKTALTAAASDREAAKVSNNHYGFPRAIGREDDTEARFADDQQPSETDTSDVRQLARELNCSTGPKMRQPLLQSECSVGEENVGKRNILQPNGKKYEKLFDLAPVQPSMKPAAILFKAPRTAAANQLKQIAEETIESFPQSTKVSASTTNVVSRMVSWLFPTPTTTPTTTTASAATTNSSSPATTTPPQTSQRIWTRNHYLLLDHYYILSLTLPVGLPPHTTTNTLLTNNKQPNTKSEGPPLPPAYFLPLSQLPPALIQHLNLPVTTHHPSLHPLGKVSEHWLRVAFAFLEVAKQRGVPLLCDGALERSTQESSQIRRSNGTIRETEAKIQGEYPKRGPDGRVLRVREDWCGGGGEWEVLRRVYSLWVRDQLRGVASADKLDNVDVVDEEVLREAERRTVLWVEEGT